MSKSMCWSSSHLIFLMVVFSVSILICCTNVKGIFFFWYVTWMARFISQVVVCVCLLVEYVCTDFFHSLLILLYLGRIFISIYFFGEVYLSMELIPCLVKIFSISMFVIPYHPNILSSYFQGIFWSLVRTFLALDHIVWFLDDLEPGLHMLGYLVPIARSINH